MGPSTPCPLQRVCFYDGLGTGLVSARQGVVFVVVVVVVSDLSRSILHITDKCPQMMSFVVRLMRGCQFCLQVSNERF